MLFLGGHQKHRHNIIIYSPPAAVGQFAASGAVTGVVL